MTDDELQAIRDAHRRVSWYFPDRDRIANALHEAHAHRGLLLAEVDRLREALAGLRLAKAILESDALERAAKSREQIADAIRKLKE